MSNKTEETRTAVVNNEPRNHKARQHACFIRRVLFSDRSGQVQRKNAAVKQSPRVNVFPAQTWLNILHFGLEVPPKGEPRAKCCWTDEGYSNASKK
jgi:hypothetical protein